MAPKDEPKYGYEESRWQLFFVKKIGARSEILTTSVFLHRKSLGKFKTQQTIY